MASERPTTAERIRQAALEGFARDGVAATSIRKIADVVGVSAALVQHYYPTKAALQDAVDELILNGMASAYADVPGRRTGDEVANEIGQRITAAVKSAPLALRYVARGLVDRDPRAQGLLDGMVKVARRVAQEDQDAGRFWPDIDLAWAPLHALVYTLGVVVFEQAIQRQLPEPLHSDTGLERWRLAATDLFRHGLYRPGDET